MEITKPIFIVGVPRSGTTLLYRLLAQHPDLGWFSKTIMKKLLTKEFLQFVYLRRRIFGMRKMSYPLDAYNERFFATTEHPLEFGYLWDSVFKGFWDCKVSQTNLQVFIDTVIETLQEQKKSRFLGKALKNSIRIPFLKDTFNDSIFVHIIRDPRSVVNSMLRRASENASGYFGMPLKKKLTLQLNDLEKHALQWKEVTSEIRKSKKIVGPQNYIEIHYEKLVKNPDDILNEIVEFCELQPFQFKIIKDVKKEKKKKSSSTGSGLITPFVPPIENRNDKHDNDEEIIKYTSPLCYELNYA